jgi:hypothetical protein
MDRIRGPGTSFHRSGEAKKGAAGPLDGEKIQAHGEQGSSWVLACLGGPIIIPGRLEQVMPMVRSLESRSRILPSW